MPQHDPDEIVTVTMTREHMMIQRDANEILWRAHLGQLDHLFQELHAAPDWDGKKDTRLRELRDWLNGLTPLVTGFDHPATNHGINSDAVPDRARVAYDLWHAYSRALQHEDLEQDRLRGGEPRLKIEEAAAVP